MIIDTHTHFYDPQRPQGVPWPGPDNDLLYRTVLPRHYKELAEPLGVTGTVVVEASAWLEDNQWVLDLAAEDPFIVGLVGHIDPGREAFAAELGRFADHPLFCGIRVGRGYFADEADAAFLRDMEKLATAGLALDVLLGAAELPGVAALAARLPQMPIVIDHVAHVPIDGGAPDPAWLEAMQGAAAHPRVYCKVSGLVEASSTRPAPAAAEHYRPTLDALWQIFGPERLFYGSNWPVCEVAGSYATVHGIAQDYFAAKGEDALARFNWRNSRDAYGWNGSD